MVMRCWWNDHWVRRCHSAPVLLDLHNSAIDYATKGRYLWQKRIRLEGAAVGEEKKSLKGSQSQKSIDGPEECKGGELAHTMDAESNFCAKLWHRCVAIGTLTVKPPSPLRSERGEKKSRLARKEQLQQHPEDEAKAHRVEQKVSVTKESKRMANFCPPFSANPRRLCAPQLVSSRPTASSWKCCIDLVRPFFIGGPAEVILPVAQQQSKKITNQGVWRVWLLAEWPPTGRPPQLNLYLTVGPCVCQRPGEEMAIDAKDR
jgi:hypothetical protein